MRIPVVGSSYFDDSIAFDMQRTMNRYPELSESGSSKNVAALKRTPGLKKFCTLPKFPIRGLWGGGGRLFAVADDTLYEIFNDGTFSARPGTVGNDPTIFGGSPNLPVKILSNGNQLLIISAGLVYCDSGGNSDPQPSVFDYTYTDLAVDAIIGNIVTSAEAPFQPGDAGSWLQVTGGTGFTPGLKLILEVLSGGRAVLNTPAGIEGSTGGEGHQVVTGISAAYLDSSFIVASGWGSSRFNISEVKNGALFDPLDTASKEGYPDHISCIIADNGELYIFGQENATEVWKGTEDPNNPYKRFTFIHHANVAPYATRRVKDGICWIAGDVERGGPYAVYAQGYQPQRISTPAVEQAWSKYAYAGDAEAYSYVQNGHHFWVISFPTGDATWVWDATTNLWHERGRWDQTLNDGAGGWRRHRSRGHAYTQLNQTFLNLNDGAPLSGRHYVGDFENGNIYEMSMEYLDDDGEIIRRERTLPHLAADGQKLFFGQLELDTDVAGDTVQLSFSDNRGKTFSTPRKASNQEETQYGVRMLWRLLGASFDRVWRFTEGDKADRTLINAYVPVNGK